MYLLPSTIEISYPLGKFSLSVAHFESGRYLIEHFPVERTQVLLTYFVLLCGVEADGGYDKFLYLGYYYLLLLLKNLLSFASIYETVER